MFLRAAFFSITNHQYSRCLSVVRAIEADSRPATLPPMGSRDHITLYGSKFHTCQMATFGKRLQKP
jgi:hypothetical protein